MKLFYKISIFLIFFPAFNISAQGEMEDITFKAELYGGFVFHTSGWGANYTYSKYLTYKSRSIFQMDFYSLKDPKETKVRRESRAKKFVFGKLYSAHCLDINYGRKQVISYDYKNKGIEVALKYTVGPSFLFLKPEYILVSDQTSRTPTLQRFNPEQHNLFNIYGGAPRLSGLSETNVNVGLNTKVGLSFDYSPYRDFVRVVEVGLIASYYSSSFKTMSESPEKSFVPNLYLNILFGSVRK